MRKKCLTGCPEVSISVYLIPDLHQRRATPCQYPIRGGEIRYTTDGTEPTLRSELWKAPVACDASVVKAKLFYLNKESVTSTLKVD